MSLKEAKLITSMLSIGELLGKQKFSLNTEKELQVEIAQVLEGKFIQYKREVIFSKEDIIDFMVEDGIGMEVKIKGTPRNIFRQVMRYCNHTQVKGLILVTNKSMGLPSEINGKQIHMVKLGKAWL